MDIKEWIRKAMRLLPEQFTLTDVHFNEDREMMVRIMHPLIGVYNIPYDECVEDFAVGHYHRALVSLRQEKDRWISELETQEAELSATKDLVRELTEEIKQYESKVEVVPRRDADLDRQYKTKAGSKVTLKGDGGQDITFREATCGQCEEPTVLTEGGRLFLVWKCKLRIDEGRVELFPCEEEETPSEDVGVRFRTKAGSKVTFYSNKKPDIEFNQGKEATACCECEKPVVVSRTLLLGESTPIEKKSFLAWECSREGCGGGCEELFPCEEEVDE